MSGDGAYPLGERLFECLKAELRLSLFWKEQAWHRQELWDRAAKTFLDQADPRPHKEGER